jgi:hypothetical protein
VVFALQTQVDTLRRLQVEPAAELAAWNSGLLNYDRFAGDGRNGGGDGRGSFRLPGRNLVQGLLGCG